MKVLAAIGVGVPVLGVAIAILGFKYCKPINADTQPIQDAAGLVLKNPDASLEATEQAMKKNGEALRRLQIEQAKSYQLTVDKEVTRNTCIDSQKACCGSKVAATLEELLGRVEIQCPSSLKAACKRGAESCLAGADNLKLTRL